MKCRYDRLTGVKVYDAGQGARDGESCGDAEDAQQQREVELRQRTAPGGMSMDAHHRHRTMVLRRSCVRCLQSHPRRESPETAASLLVFRAERSS